MSVWRTSFDIPVPLKQIELTDQVLLLGSCFTEHIGTRMQAYRMDALHNPSGIIFNPISLAQTLRNALTNTHPVPSELFLHSGVYRHFDFHSALSHPDAETTLKNLTAAVESLHHRLQHVQHIAVTFGASVVYSHQATNRIVANNHKLPAGAFVKRQLKTAEIIDDWVPLMQAVERVRPEVQWIFTVSPVRHIRDGIVGNMRSKAVLIEAVHQIIAQSDRSVYFPAYEIMMDDLRDYRFYAADMIHPSDQAIDYIWERLMERYAHKELKQWMSEYTPLIHAKNHRPLFPDSSEHKQFKAEQCAKLQELQLRYPSVSLVDDLKYFS